MVMELKLVDTGGGGKGGRGGGGGEGTTPQAGGGGNVGVGGGGRYEPHDRLEGVLYNARTTANTV